MDCKELTLELRTNKLKYATYTSLGGVLLFLLSSVIYLLVIVSHLNSIIDATNSRHLNDTNSANPYYLNGNLESSSGLVTGSAIKAIVPNQQNMQADFYYNLTRTETMLIKHIENIKKELGNNITNMKNEHSKMKDEHTKIEGEIYLNISNTLVNFKMFSNNTKQYLEREIYKNLTKLQNIVHANKKQHQQDLDAIVDSINMLIMKNISYLKNYIIDTKQTLKNNISYVRLVTKGELTQHKSETAMHYSEMIQNMTKLQQQLSDTDEKIAVNEDKTKEQLNVALVGKHMYWESCPGGWNETGGIYPVKVCVYK